jgi:hypothetical protein
VVGAAATVKVIVFAEGVELIIQQIPLPCWSSIDTVAIITEVAETPGTVTAAVRLAPFGQLKIPDAVAGLKNESLGVALV